MFFKNRVYSEPAVYESVVELADKLTQQTWTKCSSFRYKDLLILNDSTSEDGAQEYAIVKGGRQIESITFSWCDPHTAAKLITRLQAGHDGFDMGPVVPSFHPRGTTCGYCA